MPRVHTLPSKAKKSPGLTPLQPRKVPWQSTSMGGHKPCGFKPTPGFISQTVDAAARIDHFGSKQ
jgi:hypothetical protein